MVTATQVEVIERDRYDREIQDLAMVNPETQWKCECGSLAFEVFYGDHTTYIRCTGCRWVASVHSG